MKNQIIRFIWFYDNNYKIDNDKIGKKVIVIFAANLTTLKNS